MIKTGLPVVLLGLTLAGCGSSVSTTSGKPVPTAKIPSYIRVLNLSGDTVELTSDGGKVGAGFEDGALSTGIISSPKNHKATGLSGSSPFNLSFKCESGKFTTVVVRKVAGKITAEAFTGGSSVLPDLGTEVEFLNFTDAPLEFSSSDKKKVVPPNGSASDADSAGSKTVKVQSFGSVDFSPLDQEIWTVVAFKQQGKVIAKAVRSKGPLRITGAGTSKAG